MNRILKFRVWLPEDTSFSPKGMYTGFSFQHIYSGRDEASVACEDGKSVEEPEWDKMVVMQFTGLTDVNGTPIYEGDILTSENKSGGVVEWDAVELKFWAGEHEPYRMTNSYVIGNVFEHPHLVSK